MNGFWTDALIFTVQWLAFSLFFPALAGVIGLGHWLFTVTF